MTKVGLLAAMLVFVACSQPHKSGASAPSGTASQDSADASGSITAGIVEGVSGGFLSTSDGNAGDLISKDEVLAPAYCAQISLDMDTSDATIASEAVSLATSSKTAAFYSDANCSQVVVNAAAPGTVYYRDSHPGSATVTVADAGTSHLSAGTFTVVTAYPTTFQFADADTAAPLSAIGILTGTCKELDVQFFGAQGEPVDVAVATPVSLSVQGAGQLYSDENCKTAVTTETIGAGNYDLWPRATLYFRSPTAGSVVLTATVPSLPALSPAKLTVTVTPG